MGMGCTCRTGRTVHCHAETSDIRLAGIKLRLFAETNKACGLFFARRVALDPCMRTYYIMNPGSRPLQCGFRGGRAITLSIGIILHDCPHSIIILAFVLQYAFFLQSGQITFDGTLAYRQCLRHLFACHCRRGLNKVQYLLLTSSEFSLRHISVMLSDIGHVGGGKDDGLKLSRCGPKNGLQLFPLNIHLHIREFAPAYS